MSSQPYDFLHGRREAVADPKHSDVGPHAEPHPEHDNPTVGGLVAGSVLSAGLGIWLARRRRKPAASVTTAPAKAKVADSAKPLHYSAVNRDGKPHGIERAIRVATLLLPLVAAYRKNSTPRTTKVVDDSAARLVHPSGARISNIKADLEPSPTEYLDPAAEVKMIKGGTRLQQGWQMTVAAVNAWLDDFAPSMGAAIAYYTIFSIAPMLVIAIAVAGMVFGHDAAQGEIVNQIRDIVGTEGAIAIQGLVKSASEPREGLIAAAISVVTLAVGATAVFSELQSALDRIWRIPAVARKTGVWQLLRTRLLSFGLILGLGFMLIISLVVSAGLAAIGRWWGGWFEGWQLVLQALNFALSFVVFSTLFSVIYKFMPRVTLSWRDVWIGAVATTILFIIGKYLIGLYLGSTGMTSGFGAAGSFALLLVWIYYSAQIFLLGAEFTWIYANNFGSRAVRQKLVSALHDHQGNLAQTQDGLQKVHGSGH
ncbi:YihY/virulence factor BrkB family protein [Herbaspirillum sp. alder98]|uniref:YihY/virulence factor BrkB family protein n=1 Tax=Herbaspirillum sp. alder98 TaxID=2913096 RepID=UPI001CD84768|nr:YihY/virulence factor BrkB family protein [Herbaspirillum sp. alder98]MCA1323259.1 YihY/virulence factor BrkB family protein [Herbaspirillum sp. alder98]